MWKKRIVPSIIIAIIVVSIWSGIDRSMQEIDDKEINGGVSNEHMLLTGNNTSINRVKYKEFNNNSDAYVETSMENFAKLINQKVYSSQTLDIKYILIDDQGNSSTEQDLKIDVSTVKAEAPKPYN